MRSNNNFNPTTPLLSTMLIAIALLIIAILMLVFRDNSPPEVVQPPEVNEEEIVATAIAGLSATQTAFPTLPPTATQLPTATPIPPTETPVPPTETPLPPTETPEPTEEVVAEEEAAVEDDTAESTDPEAAELDATETVTDTTPIIATDALTETVEVNESGGITSQQPVTPTVPAIDPALCTSGPLIIEDGCTYDIAVGFSVFNPDTGIHDYYLSNTGTCDIPATHKLVEISSDLTTATFDVEYTIGGEFFPVGLEPDPNYAANGGEEPPFVFLNFLIPEESGTYESCWRLADEDNNFYGEPLTTEITIP